MLNILFFLFIALCAAYLLFSPRKELPFMVILYAMLQYALTLSMWIFQMTHALTALLLGFIVITAFLLIWARNLNYSRELNTIKLFFSLSQWVMLLCIGIFISLESPYYKLIPTSSWHSHVDAHSLSIHPVIKLCGNIFIFTTFFQVISHWGQKWKVKQSLFTLLPILFYYILIGLLRYFQISGQALPKA